MKLKKIHISGFKSFADRLNLEFGEGVTCIVGPNGCGKSNTSDAVRWVLGEQNPRALRANHMQDLIFAGTDARKAEGLTEVRLVFENEDGHIPLPYSEVEIGRRLYRSGESEYFINKESVRLKDIVDIFTNTGIGTHSYSLLEQGRVDGILKAKPMDRREIFEEASGITKYRMRQEEATRKLKRVSQDLQRVDDIVGELSRQVRSLKIQAGRASRYNEMHMDLHRQELVRIHRQRACLLEVANREQDACAKAAAMRLSLLDQAEKGGKEMQTARGHVDVTRQALLDFRSRKHELESEIRRTDDQLSHCRAMESELKKQGERTRELLRTLSQEFADTGSSIEARIVQGEKMRENLGEIEAEENLLESQEAEGRKERDEARRAAESAAQKLRATERAIENFKRELEHIQRDIASIEERGIRLSEQSRESEEELTGIDLKVSATDTIHKDTKAELEKVEAIKASLLSTLKTLERELSVAREENEKLRSEKSRLNHRLESLKELQIHHEGQGEGVKQAFTRKSKGEKAYARIQGVLIEQVHVDAGYEDAIESALSNWLQSVVVEDMQAAREILESLRQTKAGRLTCVARDQAAATQPAEGIEADNRWRQVSGAVLAFDVVKVNPEYIDLVRPALMKTVIVPDLSELYAIQPLLGEGWTAVTRQGEIAAHPCFLTGGKIVTTGYLKRQSEINAIEKTICDTDELWRQSEEKLQKIRDARRDASEEVKVHDATIHGLVIRIASKHEEMQGLAHLRQKVEKNLETSRLELDRLTKSTEALFQKRLSIEEKLQDQQSLLEGESEASGRASGELQRVEEALVDLQAKHRLHRETFISLKKDLERCQSEITQTRQRNAHLETRIAELKREDEERDGKMWDILEKKKASEDSLKSLFEKVDEIERHISEQEANLSQVEERYRSIEEQANQIRDLLKGKEEEIQKLEMEMHRHTVETENLERRLAEELQSTWEQCEQIVSEWTDAPAGLEELSTNIASLRDRISKMGEINPLAVQEYNEQKERLDFLTQQQDDLVKARNSLQRTISEVKASARKQFLDTFREIRQNFNRTFRRIFGGGRADLILLDESDVLTSGMEIVAQPPGKKSQSITLLSGGEKSMTAIALLFAIYQVKASPYCFLDEVDAALDDANVDRFARLLLDYRHQTQFIIVTHNKHTMAVADRLYGVTMDKPGVSTVVSMEFERRSEYNLTPLPQIEDEPLPEPDYDAALSGNGTVAQEGDLVAVGEMNGASEGVADDAETLTTPDEIDPDLL